MSSLADLPEVVGFFSYSREDDADANGKLSDIRDAIPGSLVAALAVRTGLSGSFKTRRLYLLVRSGAMRSQMRSPRRRSSSRSARRGHSRAHNANSSFKRFSNANASLADPILSSRFFTFRFRR